MRVGYKDERAQREDGGNVADWAPWEKGLISDTNISAHAPLVTSIDGWRLKIPSAQPLVGFGCEYCLEHAH